jgi:glycine/D-amino acid oxidase-like deaminating enzyme
MQGSGRVDGAPAAAVYWFDGDPRWTPPEQITPLTGSIEADVCIVGGGYTGLWSALHIKRLAPQTEVVLVEREFCGAGAAGRNGGWVNGFEGDLPTLVERFGEEAAVWLVGASGDGLDDIGRTVAEGGIDCSYALNGGLSVATCEAHLGHWGDLIPVSRRLGLGDHFRMLSAEEARAVSGCPQATGALETRHVGSVQPALLARGLRRLAIEAGVKVYEMSPMTRFSRTRPAVVETTGGTVVADRVVLGMASWLAGVPELRRTLFIIPANVLATERCPERLDAIGWQQGRPFADARTTVHYGQRTYDDRMVFGRGGGRLGFGGRIIPQHFHDEREALEIAGDLAGMIPAMRGVGIRWRWAGPVDRAQHGMPWVGTIGPDRNIHYGAGYSGNGVGPSHFIGRTLAALALGIEDEYATCPLVCDPPTYLPVEPVRYVGALSVRRAIKRCEDAEAAGREPDPVSKQLRKALGISMPKGVELWRFRR